MNIIRFKLNLYLILPFRKINNYLESNQEENKNHSNKKKLKIFYISSTKWCSSFTKLLFIFGLLLELASACLGNFSSKLPNIVFVGTSFLFILSTIWRRYVIQSRVQLKVSKKKISFFFLRRTSNQVYKELIHDLYNGYLKDQSEY